MVRTGRMTSGLMVVQVSRVTQLGSWGELELTGASSAVLRPTRGRDVELPAEIAADLVSGVLVLNGQDGLLLYLPYAGDLIVGYDLKLGELLYPPITLRRAHERGLRMATPRVIPSVGVLHLTEATLALFRDDLRLAWLCEENFTGWTVEAITSDAVRLQVADWMGHQKRQTRSLLDGAPLR